MPIQHNEYEQGFDPENEKSAIHWHTAPAAAPQNSRTPIDNQVVANPENQALAPENQAVENTKSPVKMGALPTNFLGNLKTEGANTNNSPNTRPAPLSDNIAAPTNQAPPAPIAVSPETQRADKLNLLRQKMDNLGRVEEFKYFENKHKSLIINPLPDANFANLDTAISNLEQKLSAQQPFEISKIGELETRAASLPILEEYYAAWLQSKSGSLKNEGVGKAMNLRAQIYKKHPEISAQIQIIEHGNASSTDAGKKIAYKRLLAGAAPKIENAENVENQPIESEKLSENTAVQGLLTQMQTAYGVDMSGVKIIKNSPEADKQDAVGVSIGNEIHLAKGEFTQSNPEAMGLLAHELTHFVQKEQNRVSADAIFKGQAVNTDPKLEQEADLVAEKFLAQAPLPTLATEKAENPTDEVAQLKPKKPLKSWVQLGSSATDILYSVDAEFIVRNKTHNQLWYREKVKNESENFETVMSEFLTDSSGWTEWIMEAGDYFQIGTTVENLAPKKKPEVIKWETFIQRIVEIENTFPVETQYDRIFMLTQFRRMYSAYDTNAWNTSVIPNTDYIPQEIAGNKKGSAPRNIRTNAADLDTHPLVELPTGVVLDIGHVFAGLDAANHKSAISIGFWKDLATFWLNVYSNVDMATWLGDISSVVEQAYLNNLKPIANKNYEPQNDPKGLFGLVHGDDLFEQQITNAVWKNMISSFASPEDLLGDIDAIGIESLNKANQQVLKVSAILEMNYGQNPKFTPQDRVRAFAKSINLGDWNGTTFNNEAAWLEHNAHQISETVPLLVGNTAGKIAGGVAAVSLNTLLSESYLQQYLNLFLKALQKHAN